MSKGEHAANMMDSHVIVLLHVFLGLIVAVQAALCTMEAAGVASQLGFARRSKPADTEEGRSCQSPNEQTLSSHRDTCQGKQGLALRKTGSFVWLLIQGTQSHVRVASCHSPICLRLSPLRLAFSCRSASSMSGIFCRLRWEGSLKLQAKLSFQYSRSLSSKQSNHR